MNRYILFVLLLFLNTALSGQGACWPSGFTHDLQQKNQWLSCEKTESPNPSRGTSLWIMYDLGETYNLGETRIWNFNEPGFLSQGITELGIDYSLDGQSWQSGPAVNLDLGTGRRDYEGQVALNFSGTAVRYVLLTALSTAAPTMNCAGLAEVQFKVEGIVSSTQNMQNAIALEVFPNPSSGLFQVSIPKQELEQITVFDAQGQQLFQVQVEGFRTEINLSNRPPGVYLIHAFDRNGGQYRQKLTKI